MPINQVTVSAPSKLIICGEHSICYGKCAIAIALSKPRVVVSISSSNEIVLPFEGLSKDAVLFIANEIKCSRSFEIKVQSDIPQGVGLGSSASFCVAVTVALLYFCEKQVSNDVVSRISRAAECIFHGKSSGLDTTICTLGGIIQYSMDGSYSYPNRLPAISFLIVNTNKKRMTLHMVNTVSENRMKYSKAVDNVISAIDEITKHLWKCVCADNFEYNIFKECCWMCHYLLDSLGVGIEELDKIVTIARHHNVAAKLTGAGGGGCGFIALPEDFEELESLCKDLSDNGFTYYQASISSIGYRIEN